LGTGIQGEEKLMIKKIKVEQLEPGVFVHDFNCDWRTNNLVASQMMIRDRKIISILQEWGIREVYIDTDRGKDIEEARPEIEVRHQTEKALKGLVASKSTYVRTIPLREEIAIARNIKKQAVSVIEKAMDHVRQGDSLEPEGAYDLVNEMHQSVTRNRDALILLTRIRKKDEYTLMHSISVAAYILNYCNVNKLPHEQTMGLAIGALFHDIGKTKTPLAILNKPGKLSDEEFVEMKKHSEYSAEILRQVKDLPSEALDMGLHHHERYDGNGYPHGLKGDEIQFGTQLAAIADVFDAITSDRVYRNGISKVEGLRKLYEWSEHHFEKELTYDFIRSIGVYPIGTCVRLESGRIGVVVGSTENIVQPVVKVFFDDRKKIALFDQELDLSRSNDRVVGYEEQTKWDINKMDIFGDIFGDVASELLN